MAGVSGATGGEAKAFGRNQNQELWLPQHWLREPEPFPSPHAPRAQVPRAHLLVGRGICRTGQKKASTWLERFFLKSLSLQIGAKLYDFDYTQKGGIPLPGLPVTPASPTTPTHETLMQ